MLVLDFMTGMEWDVMVSFGLLILGMPFLFRVVDGLGFSEVSKQIGSMEVIVEIDKEEDNVDGIRMGW